MSDGNEMSLKTSSNSDFEVVTTNSECINTTDGGVVPTAVRPSDSMHCEMKFTMNSERCSTDIATDFFSQRTRAKMHHKSKHERENKNKKWKSIGLTVERRVKLHGKGNDTFT